MWIEKGCGKCQGDLSYINDEDGPSWHCLQCGKAYPIKRRRDTEMVEGGPRIVQKYLQDHKAEVIADLYAIGMTATALRWEVGRQTFWRYREYGTWPEVDWTRVPGQDGRKKKPAAVRVVPKPGVLEERQKERPVTEAEERRGRPAKHTRADVAAARRAGIRTGYRQTLLDVIKECKAKLKEMEVHDAPR